MHVLQCQHDLDVHLLFCVDHMHDLHKTSSEVVFNLYFCLQSSLMGTTLCAAPSKSYAFSTNYHVCIAMPTWPRCAPPILCWPWPPYNLLPRSCLTWIFFSRSSLMGTTLRAAPSKSYAFSTNYHACIAMPTWPRCASPILCWPWPPYILLPRSCLSWIFFVDPHWWVPLCVQCPAKAMHFKQIIMHALQYQHDVDVHLLFCFDIDLHLICSQVHV